MLAKSDGVANAFLFVRYGFAKQGGDWDCKTSTKGLPCLINANSVSNLLAYGPLHWVEPGFAGVWIRRSHVCAA
jgi:hypothetical protein